MCVSSFDPHSYSTLHFILMKVVCVNVLNQDLSVFCLPLVVVKGTTATWDWAALTPGWYLEERKGEGGDIDALSLAEIAHMVTCILNEGHVESNRHHSV